MKIKKYKEVVINVCYGGFGLSDEAYEQLIKWRIPRKKYISEKRGEDGRYITNSSNEREVIFDRELTPLGENEWNDKFYYAYKGQKGLGDRYWENWIRDNNREHPLLIKVVKKLGKKANGSCAKLKIVKIPTGVEYTIKEYDGIEWVAEKHRTWS